VRASVFHEGFAAECGSPFCFETVPKINDRPHRPGSVRDVRILVREFIRSRVPGGFAGSRDDVSKNAQEDAMTTLRTPRPRLAFTLIELLVVIAIIALLIGITIPAVQKIRGQGPKVQCRSDIANLETGISTFKSTYQVDYLPSGFIISDNYGSPAVSPITGPQKTDSARYLKQVWGRVNIGSTGFGSPTDIAADGNQCLVYFLAGPGRTGFSNPPQPLAQATGAGKVFFDFPAARIDADGHFLDPWGTPYIYFSAKEGNDYNVFGLYYPVVPAKPGVFDGAGGYNSVAVYRESVSKYINSHSFQIVSAGPDKKFGTGGVYVAGAGQYAANQVGADDMSNFTTGVLGK
jgi:prepilin-type N-terminal cleavage/methylation domain-containing protein